ncbi:MAG: hypothetical protein G01um101418_919 [Parcubacteria group bacterium Gr01-1014_18]|nr:MAG: hypothetical protein Greene041636_898 [Parcubacteria group bacterium Greene0416_36]TSC79755.1 MAG: hypothetical protein G01um101418_919 [Parcubacteria group bacterium Gr01-1014_18]TSC97909.1 MAG: hypothetical protein Greene101420_944 [Parcubacteria group bacterium Greene1014_20]TSD06567.1 MAG: hypothetical protein Greene07142_776 [Parcubacteria group bacterium Greene0714_2]
MNRETLPPGWFTEKDIETYRKLISILPNQGSFIEMGNWKGRSLCSISDIIRSKKLKVIAIDTFEGTEDPLFRHEYKEADQLNIRQEFEKNIARFGIAEYMTIIQSPTPEAAAKIADGSVDLVFIDAGHTLEAAKGDIALYRTKLKPGGILAGHDWEIFESVRDAVHQSGLKPIIDGNIFYQKM